jgi:hypothetical protein
MPSVKRVEESAHLVAVPDIAALELREGHVATVDVVEDRGDFHTSRVLALSRARITEALGAGGVSLG